MKKIPFLLTILLVAASFAASDPCKEKTNEAKKMLAKCKSIGKGHPGYEQCASDFFEIKKQAEQACRSGDLDEQDMIKAIGQWEALAKGETCKGKKSDRCATALQQLGHYQFMLEETRGSKDHSKSLSYFLEFIDKYPKAPKTPVVLYQAAAVLEASGEDEKAFKLRDRLVKNFPNDGLVPKAWLRIAEYHFMNRKFRDAISAYKNVAGFENLTGKEAALAMYHLAEAYYNIAEYETAAYKYYDYIVGADKGKYPNDLRAEAIDFMADSFAKMGDDGLDRAKTFLEGKSVDFKDYVYRRIRKNGSPSKVSGSAKPLATGKLVDKRDGETYKTVRIGDREWMAENLRFASPKSLCLNNNPSLCSQGRFYSITERHSVCPEGWRLPALPEVACVMQKEGKCVELYDGQKSLAVAVNDMYPDEKVGSLLKTKSQWKPKEGVSVGTDTLNFSVTPMGFYKNSEFQDLGGGAYFWTLTSDIGNIMIGAPEVHFLRGEPNENSFYYWYFFNDSEEMGVNTEDNSAYFSVRCIKRMQAELDGTSENKNASPAAQGSAPDTQKEGVRTIKVMSDHPGGSASNKNGYR